MEAATGIALDERLGANLEATLALVTLDPEWDTPDELRPLILALDRAERAGVEPMPVLVHGWIAVLDALAANDRWIDARLAADRAIGFLDMIDDAPQPLRRNVAETAARAAINTGQYDVAAWDYEWGAAGIQPITSDGRTNPAWTELMVRAAASRAAWLSVNGGEESLVPVSVTAPQDVANGLCAPVWERRRGPVLPRRLRGLVRPTGVIAEFSITPEGLTADLTLLAVYPEPTDEFLSEMSEAIAEATNSWRANPMSVTGCIGIRYVEPFEFVREAR